MAKGLVIRNIRIYTNKISTATSISCQWIHQLLIIYNVNLLFICILVLYSGHIAETSWRKLLLHVLCIQFPIINVEVDLYYTIWISSFQQIDYLLFNIHWCILLVLHWFWTWITSYHDKQEENILYGMFCYGPRARLLNDTYLFIEDFRQ